MSKSWKITIVLLLQHQIITSAASAVDFKSIVELSFLANYIVPDVIPYAPSSKLSVIYSTGVEVGLGNELTPTETKDIPFVWWEVTCDGYYTLALVDPDAPSRTEPTSRNWKHWFVGNIPGNLVESGETIAEYVGAGPGQDSGFHRYVFLLYKQPAWLDFDEPILNNRSAANRTNFSLTDFTKKYNIGNPVAGSFFEAQYDDYVPILYEQLGIS